MKHTAQQQYKKLYKCYLFKKYIVPLVLSSDRR